MIYSENNTNDLDDKVKEIFSKFPSQDFINVEHIHELEGTACEIGKFPFAERNRGVVPIGVNVHKGGNKISHINNAIIIFNYCSNDWLVKFIAVDSEQNVRFYINESCKNEYVEFPIKHVTSISVNELTDISKVTFTFSKLKGQSRIIRNGVINFRFRHALWKTFLDYFSDSSVVKAYITSQLI